MKFLLVSVFLFASAQSNTIWTISDELREWNLTCPESASCAERRYTDSYYTYACQCTSACSRLGTCCVDSPHINSVKPLAVRQICRKVHYGGTYFMVDRCSASDNGGSVWTDLCNAEWNYEDDILKIVPVTSLFTHITYKNYFCFRCMENTDDFEYWNLRIESKDFPYGHPVDDGKVSVHFDPYYMTWVASVGPGGTFAPVNISIELQSEIRPLTESCDSEVIWHCSDTWEDKDMSDKCDAYVGIVYVKKNGTDSKYKNVHCALCNYEDFNDVYCKPRSVSGFGSGKTTFSFTHLLDINRSDGDKVGKIQRCEDNFLWDPYAKTCRKLACALPGYVVENGKCTSP